MLSTFHSRKFIALLVIDQSYDTEYNAVFSQFINVFSFLKINL